MPKISIILPVFNAEGTLCQCIESILKQTYSDFELLLINDGSSDKSGAICDRYSIRDSRIRVYHKTNGGPSSSRNLGLYNALGEYICFVDSDDIVSSSFLDIFMACQMSDMIIQSIIPNYSIQSDYTIDSVYPNFTGDARDSLSLLHKHSMIGSVWNKMFRRTIINDNKITFNESIRYREDEDFVLRFLIYAKSVTFTPESGYVYFVPDVRKYFGIQSVESLLSMYKSVLTIYQRSNEVTDKYQVELLNELMTEIRLKGFHNSNVRKTLSVVGMRFFRKKSIVSIFTKLYRFLFVN